MNVDRLGDLLLDARSGFACGEDLDDGLFQIRMNNLTRDGRLVLDKRRRVPQDHRSAESCELRPGDVLFNATNSPDLVGKSAFFPGCDEPTVFSNHFIRLRTDCARLDPRYLTRWLHVLHGRGFFEARCKQWVNQATFGLDRLVDVDVPLPPIEEQRRIAAVLDKADAIRSKRRQVLANLDTLAQAVFIDVFARSGWNSWGSVAIADMAADEKGSVRTGPFGSQLLHEEFTDHGIAVLGIDNAVQNRFEWAERRYISEEKYAELRRYTVRPGDVLVTIMGTCGRVAVVPEDIPTAINTKHLCCITLDRERCLPDFLWASLRFHPGVLHQLGATRGAVMPGLNMGLIKQAEVPLPPMEEQVRFVEHKAAVERQLNAVHNDASGLDNLFRSLQQRAFRGEL